MKFLLWLAIGFAVIWLLRGKKKHPHTDAGQRGKADPGRHDGNSEPMMRCAHCGVYLPASEAILISSGEIFCCEEHRGKHVSG